MLDMFISPYLFTYPQRWLSLQKGYVNLLFQEHATCIYDLFLYILVSIIYIRFKNLT